ncbi:hypothetical protein [Streptomyces sp. NPDC046712]|uniref:hypothetical protein n=1 Tax=Streptomyces sp. NPDC046712 TaxID=3154802 RepID=UPI0033D8DCCB
MRSSGWFPLITAIQRAWVGAFAQQRGGVVLRDGAVGRLIWVPSSPAVQHDLAQLQNDRVLPHRLLWCDPRPIPRLNRQEPVTLIVRDPGFHEPTDEDDCTTFWYFCQAHDRTYQHETCGEGSHLVALHCEEHGPESMWPQPLMLMFPAGFEPPLSEAQLGWLQAEWDAV